MFTKEYLDKLKAAADLREIAGEYTKVAPSGHNLWQARCPHPDHEDSTPSFRIYRTKGEGWTWCCMGCHSGKKNIAEGNYGSDAIAFLQWMSDYKGSSHRLSWREAVETLAEKTGILPEETPETIKLKSNRNLTEAYRKNLLGYPREYLYRRGLTDTEIDFWKIGFSSCYEKAAGKEVSRITFPLFDRYGNILGFSKRKLPSDDANDAPKYWNSSTGGTFSKRRYFYGLNAVDASFREVRITEGVMDVILARKYGAKNVIATLGTSLTEDHARILKAMETEVCLCMDGDEAGIKAAERAAGILSKEGIFPKILTLSKGMDLADISLRLTESLEGYIRRKAVPYWLKVLQEPLSRYEAGLLELQRELLPGIKEAVKGIKSDEDNILLNSYLKERLGQAWEIPGFAAAALRRKSV